MENVGGLSVIFVDTAVREIPRAAASDQPTIHRLYRPGVLELALRIIAQELDAPRTLNLGAKTPSLPHTPRRHALEITFGSSP